MPSQIVVDDAGTFLGWYCGMDDEGKLIADNNLTNETNRGLSPIDFRVVDYDETRMDLEIKLRINRRNQD